MKRLYLILASLFVVGSLYAQGKPKELDVTDFSKGLDSYHDASVIPEGFVQDAQDVYFERQAPVEKRKGFVIQFTTKSYSFQTIWNYTDPSNVTWLIVRASDTIVAENIASGTMVRISTVSANDTTDSVNALGYAFFVDQTQGVYYWNGTSSTYVNGSPKGSIITQFHNRVWVAGQAVPNGNILNGSKFLDGTVWTTGVNPTDPVQFTIGLQDSFDNITALYPFLDTLYVMKYTTIYALYGFDQTNFQNSIITRECGCIDKNTIQSYNKGLRFVSLRGVEAYDGYTCTRISDPVKNIIDPAINVTSFNQSSWVQQTAADWTAGVFNPTANLSASIAAPNLTVSSFSVTENSNTQWNSGSSSNTTIYSSYIAISTNNAGTVTDPGFESSSFPNFSSAWTSSNDATGGVSPANGPISMGNCTVNSLGTWLAEFGRTNTTVWTLLAQAVSTDLSTVYAQTVVTPIINSCTLTTRTLSSSGVVGKRFKLRFINSAFPSQYLVTTNSYILGGDLTFQTASDEISFGGGKIWMFIDNIQNGSSTINSGSFTSQVYDTHYTSATYQFSPFTWGNGTSIPTFNLLTSSANPSNNWVTTLTSSGTNTVGNRYLRYTTTITVTASDDALTQISNATAIAATTGTFTSQCHATTGISTFGNLAITQDISNGGSIAYAVCSSPNSNCSASTCKNITANSQITVATNTYSNLVASFTVVAATEQPKLQSATVQWYTGAKAPPMASAVFDNRYWLAISTDSSLGSNNEILIQDITSAWTRFSIKAGGLSVIKNNLYHSDSTATGNVYLDDQGYNDNGAAIVAYVKTKDYNLGSQIVDTLFDSVWLSAVNSDSSRLQVMYAVDNGTATYSLASILQSEFGSAKFARIPFPWSSTNPNVGQSIAFTIENNDLNGQMFFEGLSFMYHDREPLE